MSNSTRVLEFATNIDRCSCERQCFNCTGCSEHTIATVIRYCCQIGRKNDGLKGSTIRECLISFSITLFILEFRDAVTHRHIKTGDTCLIESIIAEEGKGASFRECDCCCT